MFKEIFINSQFESSPIFAEAKEYSKLSLEELNTPLRKELNCPIEGNGGHWEGMRGNSVWKPNPDEIPPKHIERYNPENKTWGDILKENNSEGITFKDGDADFSDFSKGEVKIDMPNSNRKELFSEADVKYAEQTGMTPAEVRQFREGNNYTWHEKQDCVTLQLVPSYVHFNVPHRGGHSIASNSLS